jgi:hypothetical protein
MPNIRIQSGDVAASLGSPVGSSSADVAYNIYGNDGAGGPIDYSTPITNTTETSWSSASLASPGSWKFGVRAVRVADGLEERNLDAAITLNLDTASADVSARPLPPSGLRAIPRPLGVVRVEWGYHLVDRTRAPVGFHVYNGTGGAIDYDSPAATVAYTPGRISYLADLSGLEAGAIHTVGVRAFNASGEDANVSTTEVVCDATGPNGVDLLAANPTATQGD